MSAIGNAGLARFVLVAGNLGNGWVPVFGTQTWVIGTRAGLAAALKRSA
jgi:hypothetical protein